MATPLPLLRFRKNRSAPSATASSVMLTTTCFIDSPGTKLSVPLVAVKSLPEVAVSPAVA